MDDKWRSRKFLLALTALITASTALLGATVALLLGKSIEGLGGALGGYGAIVTGILAAYGWSNVTEKRNAGTSDPS